MVVDDTQPLAVQLHAAQEHVTDHLVKWKVKQLHIELYDAIRMFERRPSPENLTILVGKHTVAYKLLQSLPSPKPPGGGGKLFVPAELAA